MTYYVLLYLHIIGATVLLGTGAGIAFFMLMAHRTGDAVLVAGTAHVVVIADFLFTASAVIAQPLTGLLLAHLLGYSLWEHWIMLSIALYLVTGAFWLPVVWMQARMAKLARDAVVQERRLPPRYYQLFRLWFAFGFPAFAAVLGIFWLMVTRPTVIW